MCGAARPPRRQEETKDYITKFLAQQDEARRRQSEAQAAEDKKIAGAHGGAQRLAQALRSPVLLPQCYLRRLDCSCT